MSECQESRNPESKKYCRQIKYHCDKLPQWYSGQIQIQRSWVQIPAILVQRELKKMHMQPIIQSWLLCDSKDT